MIDTWFLNHNYIATAAERQTIYMYQNNKTKKIARKKYEKNKLMCFYKPNEPKTKQIEMHLCAISLNPITHSVSLTPDLFTRKFRDKWSMD